MWDVLRVLLGVEVCVELGFVLEVLVFACMLGGEVLLVSYSLDEDLVVVLVPGSVSWGLGFLGAFELDYLAFRALV